MNLVTVSLGTLIDRALRDARSQYEVGKPIVLSGSINNGQTTLMLNVDASPSQVLEFGSELFLIAEKDVGPPVEYTVIRGYFGTTKTAHGAGEAGLLGPSFTRQAAKDGVMRSLSAIGATEGLPLLKTEQYTPVSDPFDPTSGRMVVELPTETQDVWYTRLGLESVPRPYFHDNVPTSVYPTGKVLVLPFGWDASWLPSVTRQVPYRWSTHPAEPDEAATVELYEGSEFLPSCYATAYLLSNREYSRLELDRSEEWPRIQTMQGGVSRAVVRDAWSTFYRKLDEARRLDPPLQTRPYVPMTV